MPMGGARYLQWERTALYCIRGSSVPVAPGVRGPHLEDPLPARRLSPAMPTDGWKSSRRRARVLRHLWQVTPSAGWSGWSDFPGSHKFAVSVLPNLNLTLTVYAVGVGDGAVYYTMQSVSTGGWTDWKSLGGTALSAPRVALNTDGTLEILAVGLDHGIWHNRQKTTDSIDWLGWQKIGGNSFNDSF